MSRLDYDTPDHIYLRVEDPSRPLCANVDETPDPE
jgi:hypothetical protein